MTEKNCTDCRWYQCYIHDGEHGYRLYDSCRLNHDLKGTICEDYNEAGEELMNDRYKYEGKYLDYKLILDSEKEQLMSIKEVVERLNEYDYKIRLR